MKPRKKLKNTPQSTNIQNNLEINLIPDVFNSITNLRVFDKKRKREGKEEEKKR